MIHSTTYPRGVGNGQQSRRPWRFEFRDEEVLSF
nr:MAG TPA: hypothetical protein [Caudoviricetes sp.]